MEQIWDIQLTKLLVNSKALWWLILCVNLMVNFMCGQVVPRYLVKVYSGHVCEGVSG